VLLNVEIRALCFHCVFALIYDIKAIIIITCSSRTEKGYARLDLMSHSNLHGACDRIY
jgi:hypothetical protein